MRITSCRIVARRNKHHVCPLGVIGKPLSSAFLSINIIVSLLPRIVMFPPQEPHQLLLPLCPTVFLLLALLLSEESLLLLCEKKECFPPVSGSLWQFITSGDEF
jgi:hypothetical protein